MSRCDGCHEKTNKLVKGYLDKYKIDETNGKYVYCGKETLYFCETCHEYECCNLCGYYDGSDLCKYCRMDM